MLGLADTAGTCNDTLVALCGPARDYHSCPSCLTKNQAALSAAGCSTAQLHTFCRVRPYDTECPAPKAAIRVEDMKLLLECYDLRGRSVLLSHRHGDGDPFSFPLVSVNV